MARPLRVDAPGATFFVTTVTRNRCEFFLRDGLQRGRWRCSPVRGPLVTLVLHAYVIMPDHAHLIVRPLEGSLSDAMRRWKSLTLRACRNDLGLQGRLWQEGFMDEGIRSRRQLRTQIDYIHRNPVRAGLVRGAEEWSWSSFGWFESGPVMVELDAIDL